VVLPFAVTGGRTVSPGMPRSKDAPSEARMRAAVCRVHGAIDDLVIEAEWPAPTAGPGEVVVDIAAAAVNFTDALVVQNRYQMSATPPFVPGSEFAGVVRSVGPGVTTVTPGQRVSGIAFIGAFAERICVPATQLQPVPDGVALEAAAAWSVVYRTAYHALRSAGRVQPGETVAVLGAGGGVGSAAVELAGLLDARVIAAASSAVKLAPARARGAAHTIDYGREPLKDRLKALTEGRGVDVVIDPVGGDLSEQALRAMAWRGRFVPVGFASGVIPRIALNLVLLKGVQIVGFSLGPLFANAPAEATRHQAELDTLFASSRLQPLLDRRYPLADTAAAMARVANREAIGKVLIVP
jgi:NADPH:quinone reductase